MILGMGAFVAIPGGWFVMGNDAGQADERPPHRVWVDAFEMAVDPVTRAEYARFLQATGRDRPREWDAPAFARDDLPVVGVSWNDAVVYCLWRSSAPGDGDDAAPVRLPTEAEWERAARGGRDRRDFPWGENGAIPAWIPNGGRGPLEGPWPVGLGPSNGYGVRGIAANVHEWCADWHARDWYARSPARNPSGPAGRSAARVARRILAPRGGRSAVSRRAASSTPSFRYTDYGFRVVRDLPAGGGR